MSSHSPPDGTEPPRESGSVRMTISLADSSAAQELMQCLGKTSSDVSFSVDCVTNEGDHPCVISVDYLSDRQLEVATLAVERGYYDKPRDASLSDLAAELDISPSAVSQHLNVVEQRLVRALVEASS